MKTMKKTFAILLAVVMALALAVPAYAASDTSHDITITTNGNGSHTYTAYQIFVGDLAGNTLSNISWGSGVTNGAAVISALQASTSSLKDKFPATDATSGDAINYTAADVAKIVENFTAAEIEAFADIIEPILTTAADSDDGTKSSPAELTVTGDGYYLIKDTGTIVDGDTATKFMLKVVNDITVTAKDTLLNPDKEIDEVDGEEVAADQSDAAIGDLITFTVTIPIPDTTEYKDQFWFVMNDQLPLGMTFNSISSVKVGNADYPGSYTTTAKTGNGDYGAWTAPANAEAAVTTAGGQAIKVVFNNFKATVEADQDANTEGNQNLIGQDLVITYTAYINDDAVFGQVGNTNTVHFDYSNNPNHDYDGNEPGPDDDDVTGKTPDSTTTTYVTKLVINKVDEDQAALAGATFEITGTTFNYVLETGEKFEKAPYTAQTGETVQDGTYYKLNDGSYTTTAKTEQTASQYAAGDDTYVLVTYSKVVKHAEDVTLTVTSGADGKIVVEGLKAGTYTIKETIAPAGYNLDNTERTLKIDWSDPTAAGASVALVAAGGFSLGSGSDTGFQMDEDGSAYQITIENQSGAELPETGGIGTKMFYTLGAVLVIGAGVVLVSRKRAAE